MGGGGYAFQFLNPNEAHMIFFKFCFRWSSKFELFRFLVLKSMFFNFRFASTLSFLLLKSIDRREPGEFGSNVAFCPWARVISKNSKLDLLLLVLEASELVDM